MIGYRCSNMGRTVIFDEENNLFGSYIFKEKLTLLQAYREMEKLDVIRPLYGDNLLDKFNKQYISAGFTKLY